MWTAICAEGLARMIGAGDAGRLGTCAADGCRRVFLDGSRNASRRFCSTTCQNRAKTAAFRRAGRGTDGPVADGEVPEAVVAMVRAACMALPEAYEERAWVGTRWRIRNKTFAHVVMVDRGWPPAYAAAAGSDGPVVVLTFRTPDPEFFALGERGRPYFKPVWFADIAGRVLDDDVDPAEVAELVAESYRLLAPKRLAVTTNPGASSTGGGRR